MDVLIYFIGVAFVAWAFYRVGHVVGMAKGTWSPTVVHRITAAREDAYALGVRVGSGEVQGPRLPLGDTTAEHFAPFLEAAE